MPIREPSRRPTWATVISICCGCYAIVTGAVALLGWSFDLPALTDWANQGISMFPNAAICAVSTGIALVCLIVADWLSPAMLAARILSGLVVLLSALTLVEHLTSLNLGIDTLVLDRDWGQRAAASPMRMGPPASVAFFILGVAVFFATSDARRRRIAALLVLAAAAIALLSITGYWFGADQLFGIARLTGIALLTSLVVAALSVGMMTAVPDHGLIAALRRQDAGGAVYRRLIMPILLLPLLLGWVQLMGEQAGYYDTEFGTALRTLTEIVLFFGLLWWTAHHISWFDFRAQRAQARLAAIIESSDDAIVSKSLDGTIETWNTGAANIFGYAAEEIVGRNISIIIPADRLDEEAQILARLRRGERVEHYETIRLRKDGVPLRISLSVSPIKQADGQIIGASKIARNMTDRLLMEERLRAVVDATPECVTIVAPDGSLEFINQAGLIMVEAGSADEMHHTCVYDLIAPDSRKDWIEQHRRVCAGEKRQWRFEIVGRKGTRRLMETHAVPLSLPDGRIAQLAVTGDITERVHYEREREELLERAQVAQADAERASHLKDEFLATLSHELRTPLNAILGWSQLLSSSASAGDLDEGLDAIRRNARAQTQLIDDLLDMSRIISGKVRLNVQATDLSTVIEAAIESVRPAAEAKGIRITRVLNSDAGGVAGDSTRLQQVFWNLLSNAIKFTPKGGKVDVVLARVNSHFEITISDNGIGIASEHLPFIFERFRQADSSTTRTHGGLGLGLSIVKNLIELHGGTVEARSAGEGSGSTFVVSLPLGPLRGSHERAHPVVSNQPIDNPHIELTNVRVLVVDDEPDARHLIQHALARCGAEVRGAGSAAEGLAALRDFLPQVLISDIGMPGTDGYEFLRQVRQLTADEGGATPAIALTAFARSEDRMQAMLAGYQVHVAKPIEPQELAVTVQSLSRRNEGRA